MRPVVPAVLGLCLLSACVSTPDRQFVVFFGSRSVELDDSAKSVIAEAAQWAARKPSLLVQVEGYARQGGDLSADALLAIERAKVVSQQLAADGVSGDRIRQKPRAPSNAEGVVGSRRVEIELVRP